MIDEDDKGLESSSAVHATRMMEAARHVSEEARVLLASLRMGPPHVARGPLAQDLRQLRLQVKELWAGPSTQSNLSTEETSSAQRVVDSFAQPFLRVIVDPRAAGPHTLVALRALFRLFQRKSLVPQSNRQPCLSPFHVSLDPLVRGLLACKFEQTDVGADEMVENAIADLISLLVLLDCDAASNSVSEDFDFESMIQPATLMDAFNTVFVTRNTFVHSPALCYHFEEVLTQIITAVFRAATKVPPDNRPSHPILTSSLFILEFLVNQLLHTPLDSRGINYNNLFYRRNTLSTGKELSGKGLLEAHAMHDETCALCLRLVQTCIRVGWQPQGLPRGETPSDGMNRLISDLRIRRIIQDDLCLSLLMLGQGIWTFSSDTTTSAARRNNNSSSNLFSSVISSELLTEVCTTITLLWQNIFLRNHLTSQLEAIFTGFYQRSLSLLRRLPIPDDTDSLYANQILDTQLEIILESLVDIFTLDTSLWNVSDTTFHETNAPLCTLETLFLKYDCDIHRSDVASGIMIELCRCCGGTLNEEGECLVSEAIRPTNFLDNVMISGTPPRDRFGDVLVMELNIRPVPAALQELCAQALLECVNGLFKTLTTDTPSPSSNEKLEDKCLLLDQQESTREIHESFIRDPERHPLTLVKRHKQIMRNAAQLFNKKSSSGIQYLMDEGIISSPVTSESVASFLRNAVILGLDKRAVGEYLGEIGKAPIVDNNRQVPHIYEWDRFHKETLQAYCASFHFEGLTLLDSLRMFLAAFRLPGEAQQIDRILQAFADTCSRKCDESMNGRLKLFPDDEKKASDTAYLLSFSIIMLNTDLHNPNVRRDRKMTLDAFVLNNMEYGRDINGGKQLPREYLSRIYESIRDEQIRTEGEGADGIMTLDRWKDVLRVRSTEKIIHQEKSSILKIIIVELFLTPLTSTMASFFGLAYDTRSLNGGELQLSSRDLTLLAPQAARWGIDLCCSILDGTRKITRFDLFRRIFVQLALFSGLLGIISESPEDKTMSLISSIERQGAIVCLFMNSFGHRDILGVDEWKCLWAVVFDLRDRALLSTQRISESDPDLLQSDVRKEWSNQILKDFKNLETSEVQGNNDRGSNGFFSSLFGGSKRTESGSNLMSPLKSMSGQSLDRYLQTGTNTLIWDDCNFIGEGIDNNSRDERFNGLLQSDDRISIGAAFETQLMAETNSYKSSGIPLTLTGLETYEDATFASVAAQARVRQRLDSAFDFSNFLSETRFMDVKAVISFLQALVHIIAEGSLATDAIVDHEPQSANQAQLSMIPPLVISPASEALAEVIICEVTLKNRDRLILIWDKVLSRHYRERLKRAVKILGEGMRSSLLYLRPGLEKCITGILRLCSHGLGRGDLADDLIGTPGILFNGDAHLSTLSSTLNLDKHLGEGLWRICKELDSLRLLGNRGWDALLSLLEYCASHGDNVPIRRSATKKPGLSEDDPCLKAFRSISLMLHSAELKDVLPFRLVRCIRALSITGERRNYPELTAAAMDLLLMMNTRLQDRLSNTGDAGRRKAWIESWLSLVQVTSDAAESKYANIRTKAVGMLVSLMLDKSTNFIPVHDLSAILTSLCVPIGGQRITDLIRSLSTRSSQDEIHDLELSAKLVFEPFLHHLSKLVVSEPRQNVLTLWVMILAIVGQLAGKELVAGSPTQSLLTRAQEIADEYLRRSISAMTSLGVLQSRIKVAEDQPPDECVKEDQEQQEPDYDCGINAMTWSAIENMPYFRHIRFE